MVSKQEIKARVALKWLKRDERADKLGYKIVDRVLYERKNNYELFSLFLVLVEFVIIGAFIGYVFTLDHNLATCSSNLLASGQHLTKESALAACKAVIGG